MPKQIDIDLFFSGNSLIRPNWLGWACSMISCFVIARVAGAKSFFGKLLNLCKITFESNKKCTYEEYEEYDPKKHLRTFTCWKF